MSKLSNSLKWGTLLEEIQSLPENEEVLANISSNENTRILLNQDTDYTKFDVERLKELIVHCAYINVRRRSLIDEFLWKIGDSEEEVGKYFIISPSRAEFTTRKDNIISRELSLYFRGQIKPAELSIRFISYIDCKFIAEAGNLRLLIWARNNGCVWDEWTCSRASGGGHFHIVKWARDFHCIVIKDLFYFAEMKFKGKEINTILGMNGDVELSKIPVGFLTTEQAKRIIGVSDYCLRKWANEGKIPFTRLGVQGSHRRYNVRAYFEGKKGALGEEEVTRVEEDGEGKYIIYARVSSRGQQSDLENQIAFLRDRYPTYELVSDIGSGLNFKRKGLASILDYAMSGTLREVVVTYKDRLCRWGFDLLSTIFDRVSSAKIVVLSKPETSPEQELCEDLISIITVFTAKLHGRRGYGKRGRRKGGKFSEDTQVPDRPTSEISGILT